MPEVPTIAEAGVTGHEATVWLGLLAPAGGGRGGRGGRGARGGDAERLEPPGDSGMTTRTGRAG